MKFLRLVSLALSLAAFLLIPEAAIAKRKKIDATEGRIENVSKDSISVKYGKSTRSYTLNAQTLIHLNGRKCSAAALKKGMHVEVDPSNLDPGVALSVEAAD